MELTDCQVKDATGWQIDDQWDAFRKYATQIRPTHSRSVVCVTLRDADWIEAFHPCGFIVAAVQDDWHQSPSFLGGIYNPTTTISTRAVVDVATAFGTIQELLSKSPQIAARDTLLLIDEWLSEERLANVDDFLTRLADLELKRNLRKSFAINVIIAALAVTRPVKERLRHREGLLKKTLDRLKLRWGGREVRRTLLRLT